MHPKKNIFRLYLLLLFIFFVTACSDTSINGPEFSISVELSEWASAELKALHEKIIVVAYFDGDSKHIVDQAIPSLRAVYLGSTEVVIKPGKIARFSNIQFSECDYQHLQNGRYSVTINVYPNNREQMRNALRCTTLTGLSSEFDGQTRTIKCRLMNEWNDSDIPEIHSRHELFHPPHCPPALNTDMLTASVDDYGVFWRPA